MRPQRQLSRFAAKYLRQAQVVELRFFGGLTVEETAETMKIQFKTSRCAPLSAIGGSPALGCSMKYEASNHEPWCNGQSARVHGPVRRKALNHTVRLALLRVTLFRGLTIGRIP